MANKLCSPAVRTDPRGRPRTVRKEGETVKIFHLDMNEQQYQDLESFSDSKKMTKSQFIRYAMYAISRTGVQLDTSRRKMRNSIEEPLRRFNFFMNEKQYRDLKKFADKKKVSRANYLIHAIYAFGESK